MGKPVSEPVNPPTEVERKALPVEADGWRVVQDPVYHWLYWRMRVFVLEFGSWDARSQQFFYWDRANQAVWLTYDNVERLAAWENLFLNP
jgi:hypothetical protein